MKIGTILQSLTSKQINYVVDPVLLLEEKDYEQIVCPRITNKPYTLLYLPVDDNELLRKNAYRYCREKGLAILEMATFFKETNGPDETTITNAGIEEFLSGIKYAEVIFTNSFHAFYFPALYRKEYSAFTRRSSGKVKDICDVLVMPERIFDHNELAHLNPIGYDIVFERLDEMRKKPADWLNNAIYSSGGITNYVVLGFLEIQCAYAVLQNHVLGFAEVA